MKFFDVLEMKIVTNCKKNSINKVSIIHWWFKD